MQTYLIKNVIVGIMCLCATPAIAAPGGKTGQTVPSVQPEPRNRVFLAPCGGYAFENFSKKVKMHNPSNSEISIAEGDLSNPTVNLIKNAKERIDIASYIFNKDTPTFKSLISATYRGVKVRLFLDSLFLDKFMIENFKKYGSPIAVKTLDPEKAETMTGIPFSTMHEKFGIIDGIHVFNGSSNISVNANSKYAESRFFFENNPTMVEAFQSEFDRLWKMGKWLYNPEEKSDDDTQPEKE